MTSQTLSPSFSDLKNLSSSETISSRKAVEVTLKSFQACEVSEQEILNTWCRILFQKYGPSGITDDNDLNKLFDLFSNAIKELLDECGNCENDEQIEKLNQFLSYSLELFTWIHSKASEFETNVISAFLCFGLLSIHNYLIVLSKQTSQVSATKLIEKSLQIHNVILGILTSQPKTFIFAANNTYLGSLISNLCLVGEIVPKLDIKSAVETWKCVTRLASQNLSLAQKGSNVVWLVKPMSFLIKEIGRNVQTVYTQDSLSEPIQQIEKFLKITNFYLRLLQKLTIDFRNVPFPICEEFIGTLAIVLNPPIYIAGTPVYKVIMDSIGNDLKELIPSAYRNKSFFEQLLSEHIGNINSKRTIHEIVLQVLEIIFLKDEPKYVSDSLLDAFFKYVSDGSLLVSNSIYKRFVVIFSSFQIRFNDQGIIKKLVSTVLQEDTIQALAAIDIWCTIFMQTDDPTRQSYIQFWIQMNQLFPTFSTNASALHTELLLKNLYTLLSAEEKDGILKDTHSCIRRDRLFLSLGLEMLPCTPIKQSIIKHFQRELQRLLTKTRSEFTIEIYYSIVKALKLLKSFKNDQPTEMLFGQLETALEDKQLYLMVENSLEFLNIDNASGQSIQRILSIIKMNISLFDELSTKLCFVRFTNRVAKQNRFENICQEILMVLENDEELKQLKFLEAKNSRFKEDREGNCDELWKELIENRCSVERIRSHTCGLEKVTHSVALDNSRRDVEELLLSLEHNVSKLEARTRNIKLSEPNIEVIKRSVFKLKGMICE